MPFGCKSSKRYVALINFQEVRSKKHYLQNKEIARDIILESLKSFCDFYGVKYCRLSIRNQKTKWGSCSKSGNLNFNYRIAFLPKEQRDYIIAHEVCHLIEFNHSKRFWNMVGKTIPNYRDIRKEIKSIRI